jgi:excisionase family DNA binding protein
MPTVMPMSTLSSVSTTDGDDLTVRDVATRLNVSIWTIYRAINDRELGAHKVRFQWRVPEASIAAYRAANSNQPAPTGGPR